MATKKDTKKASKPVKQAGPKPKTKAQPAKAASAKAAAVKKAKPAPKPAAKTVKPDLKAGAKRAAAKPETKTRAASAAPVPAKKQPEAVPVLKNGKAVAAKGLKPGEAEPPGDADSPLLDMSDVGVRKMIAKAKTRGYVTYDELNKVMPSEKVSSEQIEDTMSMLNEMGINVIESEEQEEGQEGAEGGALATTAGKAVATVENEKETYDRTDDPVRMYLREMGSVELLSREGEIAIAKRIEAGRELMIGALCESPLTFEAITVWRDELNEGKVLLRDIIDLEAMYGAGPDGQPAVPAPTGPDGQPLANGANGANGVPQPPKPFVPKPIVAAPKPPAAPSNQTGHSPLLL